MTALGARKTHEVLGRTYAREVSKFWPGSWVCLMFHSHCTGSGLGTGLRMGKWVWNPLVPFSIPCPCPCVQYTA